MTDSQSDQTESHETLKNLIQEYENREQPFIPTSDVGIGAAWFDSVANKLYVCNGVINGRHIWTCVN